MIKVVNKYKEPNHIYCGRGSPLGNPFTMNDESQREQVIEKFKTYLDEKIFQGNNPQTDMLNSLYQIATKGDLNLGCFCAPKACHCDYIKEVLDKKLYRLNSNHIKNTKEKKK